MPLVDGGVPGQIRWRDPVVSLVPCPPDILSVFKEICQLQQFGMFMFLS